MYSLPSFSFSRILILCVFVGFLVPLGVSAQEATVVEPVMTEVLSIEERYELDTNHVTLVQGLRGEKVRELQRSLRLLEYVSFSERIDGVFGSTTDQALRRFQTENNLKSDGKFGPNTKAVFELRIRELQNMRQQGAFDAVTNFDTTNSTFTSRGTAVMALIGPFISQAIEEGKITEQQAEMLTLAIASKIPSEQVLGNTMVDDLEASRIKSMRSAVRGSMSQLRAQMEIDVDPQSGFYRLQPENRERIMQVLEAVKKFTDSPVHLISTGQAYIADVLLPNIDPSIKEYDCVDHLGYHEIVTTRRSDDHLTCS
jgi:hypothetical protein